MCLPNSHSADNYSSWLHYTHACPVERLWKWERAYNTVGSQNYSRCGSHHFHYSTQWIFMCYTVYVMFSFALHCINCCWWYKDIFACWLALCHLFMLYYKSFLSLCGLVVWNSSQFSWKSLFTFSLDPQPLTHSTSVIQAIHCRNHR